MPGNRLANYLAETPDFSEEWWEEGRYDEALAFVTSRHDPLKELLAWRPPVYETVDPDALDPETMTPKVTNALGLFAKARGEWIKAMDGLEAFDTEMSAKYGPLWGPRLDADEDKRKIVVLASLRVHQKLYEYAIRRAVDAGVANYPTKIATHLAGLTVVDPT